MPVPDRRKLKELARRSGVSMNRVRQEWESARRTEKVYLNDTYQVNVQEIDTKMGRMFWLSIKRRDKEVIRDWRDFQEIKNELVGPENEGVELYPAESRKVDVANQYHMFVMADPRVRFPFGFGARAVADGTGEIGADGTRQRPMR